MTCVNCPMNCANCGAPVPGTRTGQFSYALCAACVPDEFKPPTMVLSVKPSRRRLTQAEWEAELQRAKDVQAADVERHIERPLRTRTGRRRSWWQRGWKR